jgi:hypothetical protein
MALAESVISAKIMKAAKLKAGGENIIENYTENESGNI